MPQDGGSFFGFEFMIEGGESIYGNESEMVIDFDSQASDTWITILGIPTNIVGIALLEMEFDGGNVIQIPGVDLETKNMRPSGSFGFHISSNGLVEITGSKILGVVCNLMVKQVLLTVRSTEVRQSLQCLMSLRSQCLMSQSLGLWMIMTSGWVRPRLSQQVPWNGQGV